MVTGSYMLMVVLFCIFGYPIIGGLSFIVSSIYYRLFLENGDRPAPLANGEPFITVFVPAHNEEQSIAATVRYLNDNLNYPDDKYEIIVIDDASTDRTPMILEQLLGECDKLRVITIAENRGKAHAFNVALGFAKGDFILSNDADTKPNPDAMWQYMSFFEREGGQNVGAVTGNMLPGNRTTIAAEAQQNELNSIIGLIKRSQMSYGGLFAFSGANKMYRKIAVVDVGGWQAEQPTEDIAIAWEMQLAGWQAIFAPHIRFFMDVPEKAMGLFRQRRRWSAGGIYVILTKAHKIAAHPIRNRAMLPFLLDYSVSIVWSFIYWISLAVFIVYQIYFASTGNWERFLHNFYMAGIFVAIQMVVGLMQLSLASYFNDGGRTLKYLVFAPWYMLVCWMVNTSTLVIEFFPTLFKVLTRSEGGTWRSPERSVSLHGSATSEGRDHD